MEVVVEEVVAEVVVVTLRQLSTHSPYWLAWSRGESQHAEVAPSQLRLFE